MLLAKQRSPARYQPMPSSINLSTRGKHFSRARHQARYDWSGLLADAACSIGLAFKQGSPRQAAIQTVLLLGAAAWCGGQQGLKPLTQKGEAQDQHEHRQSWIESRPPHPDGHIHHRLLQVSPPFGRALRQSQA